MKPPRRSRDESQKITPPGWRHLLCLGGRCAGGEHPRQPSASKDAIGKPHGRQLKVSVTAAPVAGRATDHMLRFLAPHFGVKASDIEVVFGRMNVNKQLRIKAPTKLPAVFEKQAPQPWQNAELTPNP
jgi:uncharacterized protein (TIGR00251 family)